MSSLNSAIQLIHEGRKEEARQILEPLLKTEPNNIKAWFWYVDTCPTVEKRIQVLEVCLKINPGNSQVIQALQTLRGQRPVDTPFASPPVQPPKPAASQAQPPQSSSAYSAMRDGSSLRPVSSSVTPPDFDNSPIYTPAPAGADLQQSAVKQKNAREEENASFVDKSMLSKPAPKGRSYKFYDAWMTILVSFDIDSYADVLNDPEAGASRAFEWVAYAGIISGLIAPLSLMSNPQFAALRNMPEFNGLFGNMGTTTFTLILAFVLALLTPILSMIGLAISAGIQNALAGFFGGNGYYGRTAYALAAYLAPMTILIALLGIIPLVGQCLTSLLGLYNIILNVRALRAAHSISIWQALGAMFLPGMIILVFGCLILFILGFPGNSS